MATTHAGNVGRTRRSLAALLEKTFPDVTVDPAELHSQIPVYASSAWDCCSWFGIGRKRDARGQTVEFTSWDTMSECVRLGIHWSWYDPRRSYGTIEIHANPTP